MLNESQAGQRQREVSPPLRVVPLFETLADLTASRGIMQALYRCAPLSGPRSGARACRCTLLGAPLAHTAHDPASCNTVSSCNMPCPGPHPVTPLSSRSNEWYREHLATVHGNHQEVMLGYSDSGGRCACRAQPASPRVPARHRQLRACVHAMRDR